MISLLFTRKQLAGLIGVTGALLVCLQLISALKPKPVHFQTLRELKDFALSKSLCFPEQPLFVNSFFIADHPLSVEALRKLHSIDKRDCGLTPAWRGLLWVCALQSRYDSRLASESIGGKSRIWENCWLPGMRH